MEKLENTASSSTNAKSTLESILCHLFDSLMDKDEKVRATVEQSLVKILEKNSDEGLSYLVTYRSKHQKLNENSISTLLRVIENVINLVTNITDSTLNRIIELTISEMTRSNDNVATIQKPASEILVSIGRKRCNMVMESLINQTKDNEIPHFMILNTMGTLATANVEDSTPFLKQILSSLLPFLGGIKMDHMKQACAFAIGRFSEALMEHSSSHTNSPTLEKIEELSNYSTEISIAYDVFLNSWLSSREVKVCVEILHSLSNMYPLLPSEKIHDQSGRLISTILSLYRRSIDRNSITQFLASVLKTNITLDSTSLDQIIDVLITNLFDLVCVYPDYEKPQTVKGHYEVLRCFYLLAPIHSSKIIDMLQIHLKNNGERERIKSLLVLTHLVNSSSEYIETKLFGFTEILKKMILEEKQIKTRMVLLQTIVALAQKSLIKDKEFVWFIARHCCKYAKANTDYGNAKEFSDFQETCQTSLYMLSSTVGTMDYLLKRELLNYFCMLDYTDITGFLMKCLTSLFSKNADIEYDVNPTEEDDNKAKEIVPTPEVILSRCLGLLGNCQESQRIIHILSFFQYYYPHLNPDLSQLWEHEVAELQLSNGREKLYLEALYAFTAKTVHFLQVHDEHFAERLCNKMADQLNLYPVNSVSNEFHIPPLCAERGMLLKALGLCLCEISEKQTVEAKIEFICSAGKHEKFDKHSPHSDYEHKLFNAAKSMGFISRKHLQLCLSKLNELMQATTRKHSHGFFSTFIKDSNRELENYKINLLIFESYGQIIEQAEPAEALKSIEEPMLHFLLNHLAESKDQTMKKVILNTLENICKKFLENQDLGYELKIRNEIVQTILNIPIEGQYENHLPLFPIMLRLGTQLVRIENDQQYDGGGVLFEIACKNFFTCAQNLKSKFDSQEDDDKNSFLAQYLNQSLPEITALVKIIIENDPSPSCLDLIISILEIWLKDRNNEVRICAGLIMNSSLDFYIKSMKIGCEAPSKFNQSGQMLGKIIPRCIDTNATVRQTSIDILQKTLEISCIYETLTIANSNTEWMRDIDKIKESIATDDSKEIYQLAGEIAKIIAFRMSTFQYLQFCKTLLNCLDDPEQSSAIGSSVVLKFFLEQKGAELFHAIPELIKDSFLAIKSCEISRAKSGVQKALVALTKHHPKLVCNEMISQPLPYEDCVIEYWHTVCINPELIGIILDNFLQILSASCVFEQNEGKDEYKKIASMQPFAIFCALKEIFPSKHVTEELKKKFPELFTMLLTSLATYTNLAAPTLLNKSVEKKTNSKSKNNSAPNKDLKMNPCLIVLETFQTFLNNLEMEQIAAVLTVFPQLATSTDLRNFIELLTPMAVGIVKQFTIDSSEMKQIITTLSKYVSSPYDGQRIAAIGLFSQLVALKPCGEISSVIMMHLSSSLSDPNPIVRGLCIRGLGFVGNLTEHDIEKYTETAITALLKGIDDFNSECLINIPLESQRGLSRIFQTLPSNHVESFHISLAIRIRPFFENSSNEIREAAILLFGDLCESKILNNSSGDSPSSPTSSDALREQLFANFFSMLLHLSETEPTIARACKVTLRKVCTLIGAPKVNMMAQKHLIDYGHLNYNIFVTDFVKLIGIELKDHTQDFIESCIPFLKSHWSEIRGNAAIIIGILHNYTKQHNHHNESIGHKLAVLLKDENSKVRLKAAGALGYFYGDI